MKRKHIVCNIFTKQKLIKAIEYCKTHCIVCDGVELFDKRFVTNEVKFITMLQFLFLRIGRIIDYTVPLTLSFWEEGNQSFCGAYNANTHKNIYKLNLSEDLL